MKKLSVIFAMLIFAAAAFSQTKYDTYGNARFGYAISYPAVLIPQGEADNGDGQVFENDDAKLTVFGSNMLLNETLQKEYNAKLKELGAESVSYKIYRPAFFVVSGKSGGKIYYRKVVKKRNGSFVTLIFEYDESKRGIYDKAAARIAESLK